MDCVPVVCQRPGRPQATDCSDIQRPPLLRFNHSYIQAARDQSLVVVGNQFAAVELDQPSHCGPVALGKALEIVTSNKTSSPDTSSALAAQSCGSSYQTLASGKSATSRSVNPSGGHSSGKKTVKPTIRIDSIATEFVSTDSGFTLPPSDPHPSFLGERSRLPLAGSYWQPRKASAALEERLPSWRKTQNSLDLDVRRTQ